MTMQQLSHWVFTIRFSDILTMWYRFRKTWQTSNVCCLKTNWSIPFKLTAFITDTHRCLHVNFLSVTQCSWHSLCPRYTGVVPATYDWPGQLGFVGLPHGKCAWVMQEVNKSLTVEPLLIFKHLFIQYFTISTAYKNTHQTSLTSDSGRMLLCPHKCLYKAPLLSFFLFFKIHFLNILFMAQTMTDFALLSLEAQTRMKERGNQSGWSGDHPWHSESTWHTIYGSFYSPNL